MQKYFSYPTACSTGMRRSYYDMKIVRASHTHGGVLFFNPTGSSLSQFFFCWKS